MKAMVFTKPGKPMELREVPVPEPEKDQVRIRISACGTVNSKDPGFLS